MATQPKIVDGKIVLEERKFNRILEKVVMKNNSSSGKINLPKDLIGKKVFVCWEENKK